MASIPNLFKMMLTKSEGGMNGTFPILENPLTNRYSSINLAIKDLKRPLLLPIVYIGQNNCKQINIRSLSEELYCKATIIVSDDNISSNTESENYSSNSQRDSVFHSILSIFKRKKEPKKMYEIAEIFYPDGERDHIKCFKEEIPEEIICKEIIKKQSRQFSPIDFRLISGRKELCNSMNYKAPNHYCRSIFEIIVSLTNNERSQLEDNLSLGNDHAAKQKFLLEVDKIFQFKTDKDMIKKIDNFELKKILGIIQISGKKNLGEKSPTSASS